jgi:adenine-specific DNA-methyltransferase
MSQDVRMNKIEATDPEAQSADLVADNIAQLKALFPELITEGAGGAVINVDVLKQLVGDATVSDAEEKYGLNWHGKRRARQLALTPSTGTLRPCPEDSVDWDTTQNLMIEGDNLEVLKLLQKSYAGKVKLIYIDPPYNTGKDFVYPDNFQDSIKNYLEQTGQVEGGAKVSSNTEASGRFHTDWLNMMYPRLGLARNLLKESGCIALSIDDSEVANLRMACDQIFGEENFIANIVWQKKYTRANDAKFFSANHDHILIYAKNSAELSLGRVERGEAQLAAYGNPDNHPKGDWKATPLHARSGTNTAAFRFSNGVEWTPPLGTFRRFSDETMKSLDEGGEIWFGSDGNQVPSRKSFIGEMDEGMVPVTIWDYKFAGHNHEASTELKDLGLGGGFTSPKPTRLIARLLELFTTNDAQDVVVDFFVGSGTTGQAVFASNLDGGKRRFIAVQLPEPLDAGSKDQKVAADYCDQLGKHRNIAELTKERLRRAGAKIKADNPLFTGDTGFRVYKLDQSNLRAWQPSGNLEQDLVDSIEHIVPGRSEQDVLTELLLKLGLDLCVPIEQRQIAGKTVHAIGGGVLMACLDPRIGKADAEPLALGIAEWHEALAPAGDTTCVFRDSAFENDEAKTNLAAILEQHGIHHIRSL